MVADQSPANMRSLGRAIDVLEVLEDEPRGLRLTEIALRAGLAIPTARRILTALEARERVEYDGTHYRAGIGLLFGAHAYLTGSGLVLQARTVLQELAITTGLAASVFVRSQASRVIVARVEGSDPLRYELPIGERLPLHLGGGKVLMAHLDDAEQEALIARATPFTTADGRQIDAVGFRVVLQQARQYGFAVSENERVLGSRSVAAPINAPRGSFSGAIQVAGTLETLPPERLPSVTAAVRNAAAALTERL